MAGRALQLAPHDDKSMVQSDLTMLSPALNNGLSPPPTPPVYTAIPTSRRKLILGIVTLVGLLGPLAGNIYLPALPILAREFRVSSTVINATVSVFMVVFAFGPLFWASFADRRGRRPLYIISIAIYILANVLLATLPSNIGALFFLRILQAFGSSAVVSMGAGTVADTTEPSRRAKAMSYFLLGPQCGPILGPILGGSLAGGASWRWMFCFLAILSCVLWMVIIFFLPETLRARVGNGEIYSESRWILFPPKLVSELVSGDKKGPSPPKVTLLTYWRLFKYPPIGIVSFNTAIIYSSYFCIVVQLPTALEKTYHWTTTESGVGFVAVGVAMVIGSMFGGRFSDWRRARLVAAVGEKQVAPETRLVDQVWGVLLCVGGLVMFGWFVDRSIHPAATLISTFLTGFGMSWIFVTTNAFLTECVVQQAAGAFALGNMLRSPAAAVAAAIISPLVKNMGWGWCFTGLAVLNLVVVGSSVIILRTQSPGWRKARNEKMKRGGNGGQ
ncbi:putative bicyclomycin resistance protein [Talaromyces proteolyticus]|uniref:Citrate exporter 1 n=1 Tax=Talaromyces proteolyticus TaxID=1131652 RepID=A0AAD4KEL5_9EURO|nr:putative bicyclomycin resistance protein [Talaromyces proteolyticus]KAH8690494.1 putative bicyclomycin resistance protein [Talaromyces proteolyticus]